MDNQREVIYSDKKMLQQQKCIQTSHSLKSIFIHSPGENDHEVQQQRLQTSHSVDSSFICSSNHRVRRQSHSVESFFINSPNQEMLQQQSFIQKSHSIESVFIHSLNKDDKGEQNFIQKSHSDKSVFIHSRNNNGREVLQEQSFIQGREEYLQRSEQISHTISEIIDHEERYDCVIACDTNS